MVTMVRPVKKTGYSDIDQLLVEANNLINEGNELQKDIEVAVKFKPTNPFNSRKKKGKLKIKIKK
ncbi:hypothetical protein [Bacillus sp. MRMR6]|uniref:hypothetical protein n=1 Tax=Bacillus sp. MRMR6 TaxID=1928617 RepID=UPI0009524A0B|nr:hypothetical protein [Bacillus sp. MRMR6]OLS35433.1 hypothetical protein BTR25_19750 [Bacillus sp. MRMR6]